MTAIPTIGRSAAIVGPSKVQVLDVAVPSPGPGEVLVRTRYSGISAGTEMNVYRGLAPQWSTRQDPDTGLFVDATDTDWSYPLHYGYAAVGEVVAVGEGVTTPTVGTTVFAYTPHQDYSVAPAEAVVVLPDLADPRVGVLNANMNTALGGVLDAQIGIGQVVVVTGLGVIGQLVTRLAAKSSPELLIVSDPVASRRDLALAGGADVALDPTSGPLAERVRELTGNRGADVLIEVSGAAPALHEAIRTVGKNGLVVTLSWYGGSFESLRLSGEFHHNRPRIVSSQVATVNPFLGPLWSTQRRQDLVCRYLSELDLVPLLSTELPIDRADEAYRLVDSGAPDLMQCVLAYDDADS